MNGLRHPLAVLILACSSMACSTSSAVVTDLGLVTIDPEEFRASTGTMALASTRVIADVTDKEGARAEFDSLVEAAFRAQGFTVVRVDRFDERVERITEEVGGMFDPNTGEPDSAKVQMVYQRVLEDIRGEIDPDALIIPTIEVVPVRVSDAVKVEWLGTSECIDPPLIQILGSCGTVGFSGTFLTLAFFVTVFDMDAVVMFRNGGGLQLLERPGGPVPRDKLFADEERNTAAVARAVDPLVRSR